MLNGIERKLAFALESRAGKHFPKVRSANCGGGLFGAFRRHRVAMRLRLKRLDDRSEVHQFLFALASSTRQYT
jgi:hypothetical protein